MLYDGPPPYRARADDTITIVVFGPTGAGKSTFINLASGANLKVSSSLESCTDSVVETNDFKIDGRTVRLVDTPGFDDTDKSDVEVLKLISSFLESQYGTGTRLHGIIYLHRISDNRMGNASIRSFNLFRKLCGESSLKNIVIVTTMWDQVTQEEGELREADLITDRRFFKPIVDDGAKIMRHCNTGPSAHSIITTIFQNHPVALAIQTETVDEKKQLIETAAGHELEFELLALQQRHAEEMEAIKTDIRVMVDGYSKAQKELYEEIAKARLEMTRAQNELSNLREAGKTRSIKVKRVWKGMTTEEQVLTMFMRSRGVQDTLERSRFWAALGDTTKIVVELDSSFNEHPLSQLIQNDVLNAKDPLDALRAVASSRTTVRQWVNANSKEFKKMETIMENAIRKAQRRRKLEFWKHWY